MKIFGARHGEALRQADYATGTDFCRIFENDMNRLYLLALLLTADRDFAEKCFVRGLEDAKASNPVFQDWAESWARRTIIINAIRLLTPHAGKTTSLRNGFTPVELPELPLKLSAILGLATFERFVFVMSVLEGYPDRDCKLLLNCSGTDFAEARIRALRQLAASADWVGDREAQIAGLHSDMDDCESKILPHLEVSP
ncbi:MAG TPA: hypothetical protein VFL34_04925 [Candidatus Sulfotelmatobacter sp.]|nr:hypothetical protein [Candidatus Sulfotelmatobacter sp.]